jgi:hypothetical protein
MVAHAGNESSAFGHVEHGMIEHGMKDRHG